MYYGVGIKKRMKGTKEMNLIIVVVRWGRGDVPFYHGLFANSDAACLWAQKNCRGLEWHWEEIAVTTTESGKIIVQD